jgi:DNA-binding protein
MARPRKPKTAFNSIRQASVALNIPYDTIKQIKVLFPEGFTSGNAVRIDEVKEFYEKNKVLIESTAKESTETLSRKRLQNTVILQELEIESKRLDNEEQKKNTVSIKEVESFMEDFGIQLSSRLKAGLIKELPPIISGCKEEDVVKYCKDFYNKLIKLFQTNIDNWNKT